MGKQHFVLNSMVAISLFSSHGFGDDKLLDKAADKSSSKSSIEKRLDDLEKQQSEIFLQMQENKGKAKSFLSDTIFLGGFYESAATNLSGPGMDSQVSINTNTLGINIAAEYNENFRFVSQYLTGLSFALQNPHDDPRTTPTKRQFGSLNIAAFVAQAYVEYNNNPAFKVQVGLGYVPFGYAYQQRELVLFKRRGGPQLMASSSAISVGIAASLWDGIHIYGDLPFLGSQFGYNAYTFSPSTNAKTIGEGGRLWWAPSDKVTTGFSFQTGMEGAEPYQSYGGDINIKMDRYGITAEYGSNTFQSGVAGPIAYYAEPYVTFYNGMVVLYGVADYLDNPNNLTASIRLDPYKQWQWGGGVNWLPIAFTRFRVGFLTHEYVGDSAMASGQNRRYYSLDFSLGVAF